MLFRIEVVVILASFSELSNLECMPDDTDSRHSREGFVPVPVISLFRTQVIYK